MLSVRFPYSRPPSLIKPVRVPGLRPLHIQIVVLIIEIDKVIIVEIFNVVVVVLVVILLVVVLVIEVVIFVVEVHVILILDVVVIILVLVQLHLVEVVIARCCPRLFQRLELVPHDPDLLEG